MARPGVLPCFLCFVVPFFAALGLSSGGFSVWLAPLFVFVGLPLVESRMGSSFDAVDPLGGYPTWFNTPLYLFTLVSVLLSGFTVWRAGQAQSSLAELLGMSIGLALTTAGVGFTVAHEFVHRSSRSTNWFLFNVGRHSHHHRTASLPYERLAIVADSRILPFGYTTMIAIALVPKIWFKMMDPKI